MTTWRSSEPRYRASRSCSDLADAWIFPYTDFGESHETLGRPILRASFTVGVPGHRAGFAALVDTGGPITVIAPHVLAAAGSQAVPTGVILPIRLAGRSYRAPLYEVTLDAHPPDGYEAPPMPWRDLVGVLTRVRSEISAHNADEPKRRARQGRGRGKLVSRRHRRSNVQAVHAGPLEDQRTWNASTATRQSSGYPGQVPTAPCFRRC